jgi:hypothetical protein
MPLPKNKKNDHYQRMERRQRVAAFYLMGKNQWEIARQLNCSQGTVSNDLARIREQWLASATRDFDGAKAQELAKLDRLESAGWEAWERSQEPVGKKGVRRPGDPRFLAQVFQCVETRLKILGALKGQTVNVNQAQVGVVQVPWAELWASIPNEVPDLVEQEIERAGQVIEPLPPLPAPALGTNGHLVNGVKGKGPEQGQGRG